MTKTDPKVKQEKQIMTGTAKVSHYNPMGILNERFPNGKCV